MILHNLKYNVKSLFRNKTLIFWTYMFPILLGIFFNMAFSNIEKDEMLGTINLSIVDNSNYKDREIYIDTLSSLTSGEDKLFNIEYKSLEDASTSLEDGNIDGIVSFQDNEPVIIIKDNGTKETVISFVINEITTNIDIMNNIVDKSIKEGNYDIVNTIVDKINSNKEYLNNISNSNLSYMQVEYYTLIAMACMYGGMIGLTAINNSLANMSNKGKRIAVSPNKKSTIVLTSALASYIVSLIGIFILILFLKFIIHADFGNNLPLIILLSLVGDLAGISLGILISSMFKVSENTKIGITIAVSMFLSVLSGMIGVQMKYMIDKNIPFINMINPNNMITDGFYSLYYYDTLTRYTKDLISLIIFIIICLVISSIKLRSEKYDSI